MGGRFEGLLLRFHKKEQGHWARVGIDLSQLVELFVKLLRPKAVVDFVSGGSQEGSVPRFLRLRHTQASSNSLVR